MLEGFGVLYFPSLCAAVAMEFDEAFRVSRERAELEVLSQGPLRNPCVSVEWASNVLEPLVRWIFTYWIGVRKRVRKRFSHYGALMALEIPGSGRDPGNRVYAVALLVAGNNALSPDLYWEVSRRNQEALGDLLESVMGYAWWLRYRRDVPNLREFSGYFRAELNLDWSNQDFFDLWEEWEKRHKLLEWVPWIEQLTLGAETLITMLPRKFLVPAECAEDYDRVRLGLPN